MKRQFSFLESFKTVFKKVRKGWPIYDLVKISLKAPSKGRELSHKTDRRARTHARNVKISSARTSPVVLLLRIWRKKGNINNNTWETKKIVMHGFHWRLHFTATVRNRTMIELSTRKERKIDLKEHHYVENTTYCQ